MGNVFTVKKMIKDNKGFTLIELIVTFAILSIFITMISGVVFSCSQNYVKLHNVSLACELSEHISTGMRRINSFANDFDIEEESGELNVWLDIPEGRTRLFYGDNTLYSSWGLYPLKKNGTQVGVAILGRPLISACITDPGIYDNNYIVALVDKNGNVSVYITDTNPLDFTNGIVGLVSGGEVSYENARDILYSGNYQVFAESYFILTCDGYYGADEVM